MSTGQRDRVGRGWLQHRCFGASSRQNGYWQDVGVKMVNLYAMIELLELTSSSPSCFLLSESSNVSFQVHGWESAWGHGQLMPSPFLYPTCWQTASRAQALQELCRAGKCTWQFGGGGQRGTILAHSSEHWLGIFHCSMIWLLDIPTGSDMLPPITNISKQDPDMLLCQPSSKHLSILRKSTCWPQKAALLTAKWLIALTEGQKNLHWRVWTMLLSLDCRRSSGTVKYKQKRIFSGIILHIWFHGNFQLI